MCGVAKKGHALPHGMPHRRRVQVRGATTPAYNADRKVRDREWVADLTGCSVDDLANRDADHRPGGTAAPGSSVAVHPTSMETG